MSLGYSSEHLAWIQRIGKEHKAAYCQFHRRHKPKIVFERPKSRSSSVENSRHPPKVSRLAHPRRQEPVMYEEVRGKYCRGRVHSVRPPTVAGLSDRPEEVIFTKRNSSRPLTNEAKARFRRHIVPYQSRPHSSYRPIDRSLNLSFAAEKSKSEYLNSEAYSNDVLSNSNINYISNTNLDKITEEEHPCDEANHLTEENENENESEIENEKEGEPPKIDEMNVSVFSKNTKTSQLRYIQELEKLLQYERSKRIKLEIQLNKFKI